MTRKARIALVFAMAASLAACGVRPGLTGNSTGGIISWSPENQMYARDYAAEHCAAYGKVAAHLIVDAHYGQYISFSCAFPPAGYSYGYAR